MSEYKGLKYTTRGNSDPKGKPKVYFCCHPDDFARYFDSVVKDILDIRKNAAVWFYNPAEGIPSGESFLADLSEMKLFVIPVTADFIYSDNQARLVEFPYAVKNHIAVLPLMMEPGLENEFNRICGSIHFLDKLSSDQDPTVIPYFDKLKVFLESVLISDEMYRKVRDAFDAYIFLSYRKKDRKYAQQIIRLIHENEFCRDIAIWYDEFLVPGENFNNAIKNMLDLSSLFALVVTPSLLEVPNYVMDVEYPEPKKSGKLILPITAKAIDEDDLSRLYEGIGPSADRDTLNDFLWKFLHTLALQEHKDDPVHSFLIGLAYLSGIDVEVNHERALSLITSAAEANLPEAYEKLVAMYQNGEGVERNYDISIMWQKKYVSYLLDTYREKKDDSALKNVIINAGKLGDYQKSQGNHDDAESAYQMMLEYAEKSESDDRWQYIADSYNKLGVLRRAQERLEEAKDWYLKAAGIREQIAQETNTVKDCQDLSDSYGNLGNISKTEKKPSEARKWYLKSLEIRKRLADETDSVEIRRDLSISYGNLGSVCRFERKYDEAKSWYLKSIEIRKALIQEIDTDESNRDLSISYHAMGDICAAEKNFSEAEEWYLKASDIREKLKGKLNTIQSRRDLSVVYNSLGNINKTEKHYQTAKEWYLKAKDIREKLAVQIRTVQSQRDLSISFNDLGDICKAEKEYENAREWYLKAKEIRERLLQESNTIKMRRDLSMVYKKLADTDVCEGNLQGAETWYLKSLELLERILDESHTVQSRRDVSIVCLALGNVCKSKGNLKDAEIWYLKAKDIREQLAAETATTQAQRDLSFTYKALGELYEAESDYAAAKERYLKTMEIRERLDELVHTEQSRRDLSAVRKALENLSGFSQ